jgi:uncharacterized protein YeaO (DUF488 family)
MAASVAHVAIKRAYEKCAPQDGVRVLVDRLWSRGVSKASAKLDAWMKELGPSDELRTWFGHQPERWDAFAVKYRHELATPLRQMLLAELQAVAAAAPVTLVYGARDVKQNEAVVLRDYLLHEKAHPATSWDALAKLLVTATVVAAAHLDAVAPASALKRLASPILSVHEFDDALEELVSRGSLRGSSAGWQLSLNARQQVRQLAGAT